MNSALQFISERLGIRQSENTFRSLKQGNCLTDFSSNDYLSFARSAELRKLIRKALDQHEDLSLGSTGSRLLTGNSIYAAQLEKELLGDCQAEAGLLFNSGYCANTALFSCLPQKGDTIITDEYIHASVIDGCRLSFAKRLKFKHNDLEDLRKKIKVSTGNCYVAVESVYSMDGDIADLTGIAELCNHYGAHLIVDEAHAFGVMGMGLVDVLKLQARVMARVITFGKAMGLHGAMILGPQLLKDYLINFARPFIYSTAPPPASLIALRIAYQYLCTQPALQTRLAAKSTLFIRHMPPQELLCSTQNLSPIQAVFTEGNTKAKTFSTYLNNQGFDVRPILSPTVAKGKERLRICLHLHNTDHQILELCQHFHHLSKSSL